MASSEEIKNYLPPSAGSEDQRSTAIINEFLDSITEEALAQVGPIRKDWENNLGYMRGKQWPSHIPNHRIPFTMNIVGSTMKRKAAYLTDTKPLIEVEPYADTELDETSKLITMLVRAWWDERNVLDSITHGIYSAETFGNCPFNLTYNRNLDLGRGDIDLVPWDARHFLIDPSVVRSSEVQQASFMIFEELMPVEQVKFLFPEHKDKIQADPKYSRYSTFGTNEYQSGFLSAVKDRMTQAFKPPRHGAKESRIPHVVVQEYWVRDYRRFGELKEPLREQINRQLTKQGFPPKEADSLAFEGGRHIFRAGKTILLDEENPYWHRSFPGEMISWGMEIEHPYGQSEVSDLKRIQGVINKLGGIMVENSLLMNNQIWIGDANALAPHEWDLLNDKPGLIVKKRPGSELRREAAPGLPGSTFGLMQFLIQAIEEITGMNEPMKGAGSPNSGALQESLQLAAQAMLRLQARQLEGFLTRMGQKLVANFFQFYNHDRIINMVGERGEIVPFMFSRDKLTHLYADKDVRDAFRDFRFKIKPLSSLAITKQQQIIADSNFFSMGILPGSRVLESAGELNPEKLVKQARFEQAAANAPQGVGMKQSGPPSPPMAGPGV